MESGHKSEYKKAEIAEIIKSSIKPGKFDELLELQVRTLTGSIPMPISAAYWGKPFEITINKLKSYNPIDVMDTIFSLWNEGELDYRLFASLYFLGNKKDLAARKKARLFEVLEKYISSSNISLRIFISLLAGIPGEPDPIPLLNWLLRDENAFVRVEAMQTYVRLEGRNALPLITDMYKNDGEMLVWHTALRLLKTIDDGSLKPLYLEAFNSPISDLSVEACSYFAEIKDPKITSLLEEKYRATRQIAEKVALAYALFCHGDSYKMDEIIRYLHLGKSHFHLNVRVYASRFLGEIAGKSNDKKNLRKIVKSLDDAIREEKIDVVIREIGVSRDKAVNRLKYLGVDYKCDE